MYIKSSYCNSKSLRDGEGSLLSRVRDRDIRVSTVLWSTSIVYVKTIPKE